MAMLERNRLLVATDVNPAELWTDPVSLGSFNYATVLCHIYTAFGPNVPTLAYAPFVSPDGLNWFPDGPSGSEPAMPNTNLPADSADVNGMQLRFRITFACPGATAGIGTCLFDFAVILDKRG